MRRIIVLSIIAVLVSGSMPAKGFCLGLRWGNTGQEENEAQGVASGAEAESPAASDTGDLVARIERLETLRKRENAGGMITSVAAMAAGLGLFLVANDEINDGDGNDDLKFARGAGLVTIGVGIIGLVVTAGP